MMRHVKMLSWVLGAFCLLLAVPDSAWAACPNGEQCVQAGPNPNDGLCNKVDANGNVLPGGSGNQCVPGGNCQNQNVPKPPKNNSRFEIGVCAANAGYNFQPWQLTSMLVACVEGTIRNAVMNMMAVVSAEMGWLTLVMSTLVILFYGVRITLGERDLLKRTMTLVLKLAFMSWFMGHLPFVVSSVFGILHDLLNLVTGGVSPWIQIDNFIGKIFGYGPTIALLNGLVGLVGAATFSSKVGLSMFFFGVLGVLNLLNFILQLIYTYCLAILTIGFLLVLAPITIPIALFFYTERYFRKWCDIIVSAILVPILLFAFLWMFLGVFDILIQNIFAILGGNDFKAYWRMNTSIFSWLMPSDPNSNVMLQNISRQGDLPCVERVMKPAVQTNINPLQKNAFDTGVGRMATLNFGANEVGFIQALSFAFVTLWLFSTLMKSMIRLIPQVAASIASVSSHITFGGSDPTGKHKVMPDKIGAGIASSQQKLQQGAAAEIEQKMGKFTEQMKNMLGNRNRNR